MSKNLKKYGKMTEILGWFGALIVLFAYFLSMLDFLSTHDWQYYLMNCLGGFCLFYVSWSKSAYQPAFVNLIWALVAAYMLLMPVF